MIGQIKVSVIIPVYNAEKYLHETVNSVLNQTLREIELICVDDGSTDGSLDILREYEKTDSRVKVLTQKNQFAGAARNAGLAVAKGEYVHFLDADDYMIENAYELLYQKATELNVDMLKARSHRIDEKTKELQIQKWNNFQGFMDSDFNRVVTFGEMPEKFLRVDVVPWNGIYRKAFLEENRIKFNHLRCVNDRSFYNNVITHAKKVAFIQDYIIYHRMNIQTSLVGQRAKNFDCHFESYKIIEKQCAILSVENKAVILNNELKDMFSWYKKYCKGEYGKQITEQMREFLYKVDIGPILMNNDKVEWFSQWAQVMGKTIVGLKSDKEIKAIEKLERIENSKSYRLGRALTYLPRKIRKYLKG